MNSFIKLLFIPAIAFVLISCDKHEIRELKFPNGVLQEKFTVLQNETGSFIKDGEYQSWYPNEQPQLKGSYQMGLKSGEWRNWREQGQIYSVDQYKSDTLNGLCTDYFTNGQIMSEGNYAMGVKKGDWKIYNSESLLIESRSFNEKGEPIGTHKTWFDNGVIASNESYIDGKLNGQIQYWKEDSALYVDRNYMNGVDQGLPSTYKNSAGEILTLNKDNTYDFKTYKNNFDRFYKRQLITKKGDFKISFEKLSLIDHKEFNLNWFSDEKIILNEILYSRVQ